MSAGTPGPLALVGSGEYLPSMAPLEASLLAGRPPRYVQLATAAVPDGEAVVARWHDLGRVQAERLGVEPVILEVTDRASADDPAIAAQVAGAGLIYLSGGHPEFLATTLAGTRVWDAIVTTWGGGAALAGCSAGAMALCGRVPSLRHPRRGASDGLGLLAHLRVLPHFDAFSARLPHAALRAAIPDDPGVCVVGIDEETALVGGPVHWRVEGRASAWVLTRAGREEHPAGTTLDTRGD